MLESNFGWQIYKHPNCTNEVVPIHEVIENQAKREMDPDLEAAGKMLSKVMNAKKILILGDGDYKLLR